MGASLDNICGQYVALTLSPDPFAFPLVLLDALQVFPSTTTCASTLSRDFLLILRCNSWHLLFPLLR